MRGGHRRVVVPRGASIFVPNRFFLLGAAVLCVIGLPFAAIIHDEVQYRRAAVSGGPSPAALADADLFESVANGSGSGRSLPVDWGVAAAVQLPQIFGRLFPFAAGATTDECACYAGYADSSDESCPSSSRLVHQQQHGAAPAMLLGTLPNSCHERGLVHAYWAPNAWALGLADRVLWKALSVIAARPRHPPPPPPPPLPLPP